MMADGVTAITPIGLVVGTATGKEKGKLQVASGDYNKMIDQKIAAHPGPRIGPSRVDRSRPVPTEVDGTDLIGPRKPA